MHPHYANLMGKKIAATFWYMANRLSACFWGIKMHGRCRFMGKTIFRTLPGAHIIVGDRCTFNSSHRSNLIGVYSPCMISTICRRAEIKIGDNCGFSGTVIAAALKIELGDNVRCGANTLITDTDWHQDDPRTGKDAPVKIGNNVWLGYGVKVLKGVTIGENTVIGAGSIVTHDIPANVMAAGNPCKVIKQLSIG